MRDKPFVYIPIEEYTRTKLKQQKGLKTYSSFIDNLLEIRKDTIKQNFMC